MLYEKKITEYSLNKNTNILCTATIEQPKKPNYRGVSYNYKGKNYKYSIRARNSRNNNQSHSGKHGYEIVFYANTYSENFIEALADFIKPYLHSHLHKKLTWFNMMRADNSVYIDRFIKEHKDDEYTRELILEFLIKSCVTYSPEKTTDKEVEAAIQLYTEEHPEGKFVPLHSSGCFLPQYLTFNLTHIQALENITTTLKYKKYSVEDIKKLLKYKAILADNSLDEKLLVKNVTTDESKDFSQGMITNKMFIPAYSDNVVKFIEDLTVEQLRYLNDTVTEFHSANEFIKIGQLIADDNITFDDINVNYLKLTRNVTNIKEHDLAQFYTRLVRHYTDRQFIVPIIVCDHIAHKKDKYTKEEFDKLFSYLVNYECWGNIGEKRFAIFKQLCFLTNRDSFKIMSILEDVLENQQDYPPLTAEQWMNYLKNYEDYKEMPIAWWRELV